MNVYFTNSLTGKKELFEPIKPTNIGIYTCGPTVYSLPTIGNWRTYVLSDLIVRTLKYFGFNITFVMNLTDVGHLTGDNLGDADSGEDRLEKASQKEGKTAWDLANFYINDFKEGFLELNLIQPKIFCRATDHIPEQIALVKKLEEKGLTYKIDDGIYFDVIAYEKLGVKYGQLSTLSKIKEGARVEVNPQKKNPRDFALWKFSPTTDSGLPKRQMEWESPWGIGFPGWHLECSAMSMKYLGNKFDIHIGGEDLRSIHHPNEIAQSEGASGERPFVKYWIHGAFITVDNKRMGKSVGNAYTLGNIKDKGFNPYDLKYFYMTGNYRKQMNFTWDALTSAQNSLTKLKMLMAKFSTCNVRTALSTEKLAKVDEYRIKFNTTIADDLNMPQALAVVWEVVKSNIPDYDKYDLICSFDEVFGLDLTKNPKLQVSKTPNNVEILIEKREQLRKKGKFEEADRVRKQINDLGFVLEDKPEGTQIKKVNEN